MVRNSKHKRHEIFVLHLPSFRGMLDDPLAVTKRSHEWRFAKNTL